MALIRAKEGSYNTPYALMVLRKNYIVALSSCQGLAALCLCARILTKSDNEDNEPDEQDTE